MVGDQYEHLRAVGCDEQPVDWYTICGMERLAGSMATAPVIRDRNPAFAAHVASEGVMFRFKMGLD